MLICMSGSAPATTTVVIVEDASDYRSFVRKAVDAAEGFRCVGGFATADEALMNAARHTLKEDELVVVMAKAQPERFSGGLRLSIQQVWDLPQARCRFGKYLRVQVNGTAPDVSRLLREHPARVEMSEQGELVRGLGIRVQILRDRATAELQLGEGARFFPTDAALASWMAQAHEGQAQIVYD